MRILPSDVKYVSFVRLHYDYIQSRSDGNISVYVHPKEQFSKNILLAFFLKVFRPLAVKEIPRQTYHSKSWDIVLLLSLTTQFEGNTDPSSTEMEWRNLSERSSTYES